MEIWNFSSRVQLDMSLVRCAHSRYRVNIPREIPCRLGSLCYSIFFKLSFIDPQIKTPTLLFLGADDVRVPPKQGTNFHRLLKAKGVETR